MSQQMKTITTPDGRKIQSKVFAVGQRVMHNSPATVIESDATGHYEGHVTLKGERDGIVFVAWANYCDAIEGAQFLGMSEVGGESFACYGGVGI